MTKSFISTIGFLAIFCFGQSQNNHCSFTGELSINYYKYLQGNYSNDFEIDKIINDIVREIGLEKNFVYVNSPGLNNCAALNYDGFRYILYDKTFLNLLSDNQSSKRSVYVSVLAHEIGHHLCSGKTFDNLKMKCGCRDIPDRGPG